MERGRLVGLVPARKQDIVDGQKVKEGFKHVQVNPSPEGVVPKGQAKTQFVAPEIVFRVVPKGQTQVFVVSS